MKGERGELLPESYPERSGAERGHIYLSLGAELWLVGMKAVTLGGHSEWRNVATMPRPPRL